MELLLIAAVGLLLLALVAMIVVWAIWRRSRGAAARLIANANKESKRIAARAEIEHSRDGAQEAGAVNRVAALSWHGTPLKLATRKVSWSGSDPWAAAAGTTIS